MSNNNQSTKVIVTFPDKIQVDLVSSNELKLYERFQWLVALLLPIAIGFFTAYFIEPEKNSSLLWSGIVLAAISGVFIFFAIGHRKRMFNGKISREKSLNDFN
jgi:hypothetical protein